MRVGRSRVRRELVVEFGGLGVARAEGGGLPVHFDPVPGADPRLLAKLDRGPLDALRRQLGGKLTLHGGAVAADGVAAALLGPSGAGKSTLVARLAEHDDIELVSDDTVAVEFSGSPGVARPSQSPRGDETVSVLPTQDVSWIEPSGDRPTAGEEEKVPVLPRRARRAPAQLALVVFLRFDEREPRPRLKRLDPVAAFEVVAASVIRYVIDDPREHLREFDQIVRVVRGCPVYELIRPSGLPYLTQAVDIVRRHVAALGMCSRQRGSAP